MVELRRPLTHAGSMPTDYQSRRSLRTPLWQVDVARWALPAGEQGAAQGSSVTHLEIAGDALLVR